MASLTLERLRRDNNVPWILEPYMVISEHFFYVPGLDERTIQNNNNDNNNNNIYGCVCLCVFIYSYVRFTLYVVQCTWLSVCNVKYGCII